MNPLMTTSRRNQKGAIFLALVLVLFVVGSTVVIAALNNRQSASLAEAREVRYQLNQAKAALLAYAAHYAVFHSNERGPGFFPCPADNATGQPLATCNTNANFPKLGRLPEYELLPSGSRYYFNDYYAGIDQQFWYVVDPRFTYQTNSAGNRRSRNRTSLDGTPTAYALQYDLSLDGIDGYAALIIAPGEALATQDRIGSPNAATSYLDGENGVTNSFNYFTSYSSNPTQFNDQIIGITIEEVIEHVGMAVVKEMRRVLESDFGHPNPGDTSHTTHPNAYVNTQSNFRRLFDSDLVWLRRTSTSPATGERWAADTSYRRVSATKVCIDLGGFDDYLYVFTYGGELTKEYKAACADVLP